MAKKFVLKTPKIELLVNLENLVIKKNKRNLESLVNPKNTENLENLVILKNKENLVNLKSIENLEDHVTPIKTRNKEDLVITTTELINPNKEVTNPRMLLHSTRQISHHFLEEIICLGQNN